MRTIQEQLMSIEPISFFVGMITGIVLITFILTQAKQRRCKQNGTTRYTKQTNGCEI